jgi:hypothetical protein
VRIQPRDSVDLVVVSDAAKLTVIKVHPPELLATYAPAAIM